MPGATARALAAGQMVHERDPPSVHRRNHLVAENAARRGASELLDVRAAQPAGEHRHRPLRLRHVRERRPSGAV